MSANERRPMEVTVAEAWRRIQQGAVLVDVRSAAERAAGAPDRSLHAIPEQLSERLAQAGVGAADPVLLICASGARSLRALEPLQALGYASAASVRGGFAAWRAAGLPQVVAADGDSSVDAERYLRHLVLPQVGEAGQRRLSAARVLLVGAGGLGSPVALYLAAAGVGTLGIVDDDRVERSNLQRQVLHGEDTVGWLKVDSATRALHALNPAVQVWPRAQRLVAANVEQVLDGFDLVVDGADNLATRYLLSDACVQMRLPMVYGAVHRFEGQASVFDAGRARGVAPCYRCLFPEPPPADAAPNCAEAGVLGVLPGLVGLVQATEVLKLLLGIGQPLVGRLLHVDALTMRWRETRLPPDPDCVVCAPGRPFRGYSDGERSCAA